MVRVMKKKDIVSFNLSSNKKEDSCPYYCPVDGSRCKVSKIVNADKEENVEETDNEFEGYYEGFASYRRPEDEEEERLDELRKKSLLNRILFWDFKIDDYILMKGLILLLLSTTAALTFSSPFACGVVLTVVGILVVKF